MKTILFSAILMLTASSFLSGQRSQVNGRNVTFVKFGNAKSSFVGSFIQRGGNKQWVEEGRKQGVARFKFQETHRDDWSVYLIDRSRGVNIQIDLHTKKIMYSDRKSKRSRHLYNVTERYSGVNGWTVRGVKFMNNSNQYLGRFISKGTKNWLEQNKAGRTVFRFKEVARDEWSVYLRDDSRGVNIQLDLHTKKVMYSDKRNTRRRAIYKIQSAR